MTQSIKRKQKPHAKGRRAIGAARLAEMIEEATVDAYDDAEQATGWLTMLEEHVELPFETEVLGMRVTVSEIDQRDENRIVAVCVRGRERQAIDLAELPLPMPAPAGAEWIAAYRHWLGGK